MLRFGRLKQDLNMPFKCRFTVILLSPEVNYLSDVSMPYSRVTINFFFFFLISSVLEGLYENTSWILCLGTTGKIKQLLMKTVPVSEFSLLFSALGLLF